MWGEREIERVPFIIIRFNLLHEAVLRRRTAVATREVERDKLILRSMSKTDKPTEEEEEEEEEEEVEQEGEEDEEEEEEEEEEVVDEEKGGEEDGDDDDDDDDDDEVDLNNPTIRDLLSGKFVSFIYSK